ncbi:flavodoxin family protein [Zhaonella formicivorans]|uniref:flavodoxin family protein n=1 Tax=Zhaonella formicivorans TaxID=2528593 RepID=UPI0010E8B2CB|nr:flavodoxin family protein [Zhaonella formicivorans]
MAKILGICGSVRKGATEHAVREALKAAEKIPGIETEFWTVRGKKIGYCVHCDRCIRDKTMCVIQDDLKELENLVLEADGFIIGSPVYDMNISAQLTAVFNRLRPIYLVHPGVLKNKVGGAIATGGTRHGGQEFALQAILNFYIMHEMLACGGLGGCYNGGKIWSKDMKAQGAIDDAVGMDTVRRLGRGVAEAAIVTALGRKEWREKAKELNIDIEGQSPLRDH